MLLRRSLDCAVLLVLVSAGACRRYEMVPDYMMPECRLRGPAPRTGLPLDTAWDRTLAAGSIEGRVQSATESGRVGYAIAELTGRVARSDTTDSTGRFRFAPVLPGQYQLSVRGIGYRSTRDSIRVPAAGGVRVGVRLEPQSFDGPCSGFGVVLVPKPWWKLW